MLCCFRNCAAAAAGLALWVACVGLADAQPRRQIVIEPRGQDAKPAVPQAQPEAPAPAPAPTAAAPAPAAGCEGRKFVEPETMVGLMAADLDQVKSRAKGTRYLTLTHLWNACAPQEVMEVYRQGAIKLVNSLSRSSDLVRMEPIDPDRSILRINIDDLGWGAADWDSMVAGYPYAVQPDTKMFVALQSGTGSKFGYVRADWLAFAAARPPLYNALLNLPKTFAALAQAQGVDVPGNIKKFVAQRAGFQKSGESASNRLIERHPSRSGYFWTTYDFAGNRAKQSVFEFPLGPGAPTGFDHDAGATVFSLPNGFVGYYVANAKGEVLDSLPSRMARDPGRRGGVALAGISCMGCHVDGVRPVADEVRNTVLGARAFSREIRDAVDALYPTNERMNKLLGDDAQRFAAAMARAGLDPALKLDGVEPVNVLSDRYEALVDTTLAAAELGLTPDDFGSAVKEGNRQFRPLMTRLGQGGVSREEFEGRYAELVEALTDGQMIKFEKPRPAIAAPARPRPAAPPPPAKRRPSGY